MVNIYMYISLIQIAVVQGVLRSEMGIYLEQPTESLTVGLKIRGR